MPAIILSSTEGKVGMQPSIDALKRGATPLDAIEDGIKVIELEPSVRSVGFGGAPNLMGVMECDASVMDGNTLKSGSVGAIKGFKHPISVARAVMEKLPHVLIVDKGADRFAQEIGAEPFEMLSPEASTAWQKWLLQRAPSLLGKDLSTEDLIPLIEVGAWHDLALGTTTCLIRDQHGNIAGGVSTSGWAYKYPGRLGDSPIIGAGLYVDSRYGGASCTHTGEMTIRAGTARSVVLYLKKGAGVKDAVYEAYEDLKSLQGGYQGPVIIHAIDAKGDYYVLMTDQLDKACYWVWQEGMQEFKRAIPNLPNPNLPKKS